MSAVDDILRSLPLDQLAVQLGATPEQVSQAVESVVPTLLGGMQANAQGGGARSLLDALDQHTDPVDPTSVDTADGARAAGHIFGDQQDEIVNRLGAAGGVGSGLVAKLLPMLVPIVLSYLSKQVSGRAGTSTPSAAAPSALEDILGQVLGGAGQGGGAGSILSDVLGGMLGGGRR